MNARGKVPPKQRMAKGTKPIGNTALSDKLRALGGDDVGSSFGSGGLGLSRIGSGRVPNAGEQSGLGSKGGIGRGSGPGTGLDAGSGAGGISGERKHVPTVVLGEVSVSAGLPPEAIRRSVQRHFDRLRQCYESGLRRNDRLGGKLNVKLLIRKAGSVSNAVSDSVTIPDNAVVSCIVQSLSTISFPKPTGSNAVSVVLPLTFSPGDDTSAEKAAATPSPTRRAKDIDLDEK
jgi:hypothetical protein